jgi:acyl-CoA synthetase (AMP-forming)/AMP-acid ligase II
MLQKTIPLISAIWELGGIVVVHDLPFNLQYNPLFNDFYSKIDYILVEEGSLKSTNVSEMYGASSYKLHELSYWGSEQQQIDHDPVLASTDDPALMVTGSGSLTAPKQTYFSHRAALNGIAVSCQTHKYQLHDHVLHVRALHHSSAAIWFLFSTLASCQHHYYALNQTQMSHNDHLLVTLQDWEIPSIDRVLLGTSITEDFLRQLKNIPRNLSLTVQSTESFKTAEMIDQLFDTNKVTEFISEFVLIYIVRIGIFIHIIKLTRSI